MIISGRLLVGRQGTISARRIRSPALTSQYSRLLISVKGTVTKEEVQLSSMSGCALVWVVHILIWVFPEMLLRWKFPVPVWLLLFLSGTLQKEGNWPPQDLTFLGWPSTRLANWKLILKLYQRASVKDGRFYPDWTINQAFRVDTSLLIKHKWTRLGRNPNRTFTDIIMRTLFWPFSSNLAWIELTNPPLDLVDSRELDCAHTYSSLLGE